MSLSKNKYFISLIALIFTFNFGHAIQIERVCLDKNNDITIIWNEPADTCNKFVYYRIYGRENTSSAFKLIKEIKNYYVSYLIEAGAGTVSTQWDYYMEYKYICGTEIIQYSDTISIDKEKPKNIQIDSVSVINGFVSIGWSKSESTDTKGYIIYYVDNNDQNIQIGLLHGRENTLFVDSTTGSATTKSEQYRIVAFDSCENYSDISFGHKSIFLSIGQNSCEKLVSLNWSHYSAWAENARIYELLIGKNGGSFVKETDLPGNSTTYNIYGLDNETDYCFVVRARNLNKGTSASSNTKCLKTDFIESPDYIYLRNVTVKDDAIELSWITEQATDINEYRIYKGEAGGLLKVYKNIIYSDSAQSDIDKQVDVNNMIYNYQVALVDVCGQEVKRSNISQNILLIHESNNDGSILRWNTYKNWDASIDKQILYVEIDENWSVEQVFGSAVDKFVSGLKVEEMKGYEKCFYIEDYENQVNTYGLSEISKSNIVCLTGDLLAHWPNAFTPDSDVDANKSFKPIGKLIDFEGSEMLIYDSWGKKIYEKTGIKEGWDGSINNKLAPIGTYYYYAILKGKNEGVEKFNGTLHLLR